jgi:hypothetical protein
MGEINNINFIIFKNNNLFPMTEDFFGIDYNLFFNLEYIIGDLSGIYIII